MSDRPPADVVLTGGDVRTMVVGAPRATAVAVRGDRIVAVGSDPEVSAWVGAATTVVPLAGRTLVPGFCDAHVHTGSGGLNLTRVNLLDADPARYGEIIRTYADTHPDAAWILGSGWALGAFERGIPTRHQLDALVPDRPVLLMNRDQHAAWVNTRALELAGIDSTTPDPHDGRIERDDDGTPIGLLQEGASALVGRFAPAASETDVVAGLLAAQAYLHSLGITSWQEAIVNAGFSMVDPYAAYRSLDASGRLQSRVRGALWYPRGTGAESMPALVAQREAHDSDRFTVGTLKVMIDGVCENHTASMLTPYEDGCGHATGNTGLAFFEPEQLVEIVRAANEAGFQVHMHAIGDAAVRSALDAVAADAATARAKDLRHHVAHVQVVHPDDIPRFAALDVTVNAQPLWAAVDGEQMLDLTLPFLGDERGTWQYPFGGMLGSGARLAMGSDWPVSSPDPLAGIATAVTRQTPPAHRDPRHPGAFLPHQSMSLDDALRAYTAGSTWVNHDDDAGTVAVGRRADLVVLDRPVAQAAADDLFDLAVDLTLVAGRLVHSRH